MICFNQILLLLSDGFYTGAFRTNYDLFSTLFCDYLEENPDYDLDKSSMSRWRNGRSMVSLRIVRYYIRLGYDLVLATTIEECFAPHMRDICGLAEHLYRLICDDQQLSPVEQAILCNGYVVGEIGPSAELIARVIIHAMQQPLATEQETTAIT